MSSYINIYSLAFPFHEGDIRLLHPEIREDQTGDTFPCPPEFAKVEDVVLPDYDIETHKLVVSAPFKIDGVWKRQCSVLQMTADEITQRQNSIEEYKKIFPDAQANPTS